MLNVKCEKDGVEEILNTNYVTIDQDSGVIENREEIDFEKMDQLFIEVEARDGGTDGTPNPPQTTKVVRNFW